MTIIETLAGASRATLGFFTGWKLALAAAVVSAAGAGWAAHMVTANAWRADYNELKAEYATQSAVNTSAVLEQFKRQVGVIQSAAADLSRWQIGFDAQMGDISKELRNAIAARPLSPDCRPDAERMRINSKAVSAANAARTAGQ